MSKYKAICLALEDIASESANTDARIKALSFLRLLQAPAFIVSIVVAQFVLSFSHPLSLSLQKISCDALKAYENCASLLYVLSVKIASLVNCGRRHVQ